MLCLSDPVKLRFDPAHSPFPIVIYCLRAAIATMEKQERARIIAMADLKERMKGKEAMALEQGKKMAEIAAEVWIV